MKRFFLFFILIFGIQQVGITQGQELTKGLILFSIDPFFIRIFQHPVRAVIFFIGFFSLLQFFQNNDKSFLFYSLYLFSLFINFIYIINNDLEGSLQMLNSSYHHIKLFLSPTLVLFYLLFIDAILDLKNKFPKAHQAIRWVCMAILVYSFFILINSYFLHWVSDENLLRLGVLIFVGLGIILLFLVPSIWQTKEKINRYIILGSIIIFAGLLLTVLSLLEKGVPNEFFFTLLSPYLGSAKSNDFFILQITTLIEILLFSSALGAKTKQNEIKIRTTERELYGTQLAIKDQEVLEKSLELEQQRRLQLESQFQQKIAEAEVKALKAQMNPHFMFNCLNTFKYLIQKNETEKAEEYLVKFSRLLRGIVDYSQEAKILLAKEIEICSLYLDMEQLRFQESFSYLIQIAPELDTSFVEIPPFIIQPFLENSIWHGLHPLEGKKQITIHIKLEDELVKCIICDNGIGLIESARLKKSKNKSFDQRSIGMSNTEERLNLFHELFDVAIATEVQELFDEEGKSKGVKVEITIPQ